MRVVCFPGTLHLETKIYVNNSLKQFNTLSYSHIRGVEKPEEFAFVKCQNVSQRLELLDDSEQIRAFNWIRHLYNKKA